MKFNRKSCVIVLKSYFCMKIPHMKKLYILLLILCFFNNLSAQIINFPSQQFKSDLLSGNYTRDSKGSYLNVDANGDKEIDVSEALKVYEISDENHFITDVTGIEYFTNLVTLKIQGNRITKLDATNLKKLKYLDCKSNRILSLEVTGLADLSYLNCNTNGLKELDLTGLNSLVNLYCSQNAIKNLKIKNLPLLELVECVGFSFGETSIIATTLVLDNLPSLIKIDCSSTDLSELKMTGIGKLQNLTCKGNKLTTLDASEMYSARTINVSNNYLLNSLFVKNGSFETLSIGNNTFKSELKFICADEAEIPNLQANINNVSYLAGQCVVSSYCTFMPGGVSYNVKGSQKWDSDANGCDIHDPIFPFLKFNITNGNINQDFITDDSGKYNFYVQAGKHTIRPIILENPSFFNVTPSAFSVEFPTEANPFIQDFCITSNGIHSDLEVTLLPVDDARPGSDANYKIVCKNKGNTIESG